MHRTRKRYGYFYGLVFLRRSGVVPRTFFVYNKKTHVYLLNNLEVTNKSAYICLYQKNQP